jgi:C_GCAxxG_C_C family probable redox protein
MSDYLAQRSVELMDAGYCCAEAVLLAAAEARGITSPLIPAIATGFCTGLAGSDGPCGALAGGVLALNMIYGRSSPEDLRDANYRAVQNLIARFGQRFGATQCTDLLGCNPGTRMGRIVFSVKGLRKQCREYVATVAQAVTDLAEDPDRQP